MLNQIIIDNFATIEHLDFEVGDRLNIITGETGAGKSVLATAISTALGGRADISMVRTGASRARIQILGSVNGEDVVIVRELFQSGKSVSKINGELVTLGQLRAFCQTFVDIHGQYDNQIILDRDNHLAITDRYQSREIGGPLESLREAYERYQEDRRAYDTLCRTEADARRKQEFYQFELDHIEGLSLKPGEDEALAEQLSFMKNSERIYSAVNRTYELLRGQDDSILSSLQICQSELAGISSLGKEIQELSDTLADSYYTLEDLSDTVRHLRDTLNYSDSDIDQVSERLSDLEDAKRKYHRSLEEIIEYRLELQQKLSVIENFEGEKARLREAKERSYEALTALADEVSSIRRRNAKSLEEAMIRELQDLEFANSDFRIRIERLPEIGSAGYDDLEFLISTNPGEPLRPLSRIASGGEISRIMLAFKHIIGEIDQLDTMIFDEIDTGISGRTALTVGRKMKEIASHHQVLCITHLPQIAAYGDQNYFISKDIQDGKTYTNVEPLDEEAKLHMLAGMISGDPNSAGALEAARGLIQET